MATGAIARAFAADLRVGGHRMTAVSSRSAAKAQAFADQFGVERAYGSYEEMMTDAQVDIVYVATTNNHHLAGALLAIEAGKSVLIEKPLTLNASQARRIAQAAAAAKVTVMEAMWTRFLPHMVRLRELVATGILGTLESLVVDHSKVQTADPGHRLNSLALGGGALLDLGIYPISLAYDLFGRPNRMKVTSSSLRPNGADKAVAGEFHYPNGARAVWRTALDAKGPNTAIISGSAGKATLEAVWCMPTRMRVSPAARGPASVFDGAVLGRGMGYQAREMEELFQQGQLTSQIMPLHQSVEIIETMDWIREQIGVRYPDDDPGRGML
jgi:predicted dehydrogenase